MEPLPIKTIDTDGNPGGVTGIIVAVSENLFIFAGRKNRLGKYDKGRKGAILARHCD